MHADFEEKHGLARHCYAVYERAARAVPKEERAEVYRLFADRAQALSGIPKVREVYQMACEAEPPHELADKDVLALSLEFITIERRLQEIDRARCGAHSPTARPATASLPSLNVDAVSDHSRPPGLVSSCVACMPRCSHMIEDPHFVRFTSCSKLLTVAEFADIDSMRLAAADLGVSAGLYSSSPVPWQTSASSRISGRSGRSLRGNTGTPTRGGR